MNKEKEIVFDYVQRINVLFKPKIVLAHQVFGLLLKHICLITSLNPYEITASLFSRQISRMQTEVRIATRWRYISIDCSGVCEKKRARVSSFLKIQLNNSFVK